MKLRRTAGSLVSATLCVGLASGCSPEKDPTPIAPNRTIEQVEHNLGYEKTLGKLTLTQHLSLPLPGHEVAEVYNYSAAKVNPKKVAAILSYYVGIEHQLPTPTRLVHINPIGKPALPMKTDEGHRTAKEHDFVLVPTSTSLPKLFTKNDEFGEADAETHYFDTVSQTISVIKQPTDYDTYQPGSFLNNGALYTEICQAMVNVETPGSLPSDSSGSNYFLAQRLVQETVCNGLGEAFASTAQHNPYDLYLMDSHYNEGTVEVAGIGNFVINPYVVTKPEYAAIQHITR